MRLTLLTGLFVFASFSQGLAIWSPLEHVDSLTHGRKSGYGKDDDA